MFERFTDRARQVMILANQEAQRLGHEYIGSEHILLGLVNEGSGVGANVLKNLDVDLNKLRLEVDKLVKRGPGTSVVGKLPPTPRAKKVIEYAMVEARKLDHNYIDTEHLLLGLLRERDGVAATMLTNLGLELHSVRENVLNLLLPTLDLKVSGESPGELIEDAIKSLRLAGEMAVTEGKDSLASEILNEAEHLQAILARMRGASGKSES